MVRILPPVLSTRPHPAPSRRVRVALAALTLGCISWAALRAAAPSASDAAHGALRMGAERLLELQRADGSWPLTADGPGEIADSGGPGLALLAAHATLGDARYLSAASRTAELLQRAADRSPRARSLPNLRFLAEYARVAHRPDIARTVLATWQADLAPEERTDGAIAARRLIDRPNLTSWTDGAWKNYLLARAADTAQLARSLGADRWADDFIVAAAGRWAPKHDHSWWTLGAGRLLEELAQADGPSAQRLAAVELGALRNDELVPSVPWNHTPYDSSVNSLETAASVRAMLVSRDPQARRAARHGIALIAARQASHGGWGSLLSLGERRWTADGTDAAPAAELAMDESPGVDAQLVLTMATAIDVAARAERPSGVATRERVRAPTPVVVGAALALVAPAPTRG